MGTQHTSGPWLCDDFGIEFEGARFGEVAYVLSKDGHPFDATEANARLIAAAPDMYAAASRLLAVFEQQKMTAAERIIVGISDAGLRTEGNAAIKALQEAVASARGEA